MSRSCHPAERELRHSNRFALVCSFLLGAQWVDRQVLRGFEAYLSMTFESDRVRGWPAIVAFQCGADRDASIALLHGGGSEGDNAVAIEFLKERVAEFAALVRSGEIDRYVEGLPGHGRIAPVGPKPISEAGEHLSRASRWLGPSVGPF